MFTAYHYTGYSQDTPSIISKNECVGRDWTDCATLFLERKSSDSQSGNHGAGIRELRKAHAELKIPTPFRAESFTGSNSLRYLHDPSNRFFPELREAIQDGLARTQKTLYVFFTCLDRLMRPVRFDHRQYKATSTLTESDYQTFWEWMVTHFGSRARNIVYVVLNDAPNLDRAYATKTGMDFKGKKGGKPKKQKTRIDPKTSERLQKETVRLAETTSMDGADIWNHFRNRGESVSYSAVKRWLNKNGLARKPGKRARKTFPEDGTK